MLITGFVASEATGRFPESKTSRMLEVVGRLQAERAQVSRAVRQNVRRAR